MTAMNPTLASPSAARMPALQDTAALQAALASKNTLLDSVRELLASGMQGLTGTQDDGVVDHNGAPALDLPLTEFSGDELALLLSALDTKIKDTQAFAGADREKQVALTLADKAAQEQLIHKIIDATGLESCTPRSTPAALRSPSRDEYGAPTNESWSHSSVLEMLQHLAANTRPDIAFADSEVARISTYPTASDASVIKRIVRYLAGTAERGTVLTPRADLKLELFCSANVDSEANRPRTGFIIVLRGFPVVWRSKRLPILAVSTFDATCANRLDATRTLSHLLLLLKEIAGAVGLPPEIQSTIRADAFEDNQGSRALATYRLRPNPHDDADYLTAAIPQEAFQENRRRTQGW